MLSATSWIKMKILNIGARFRGEPCITTYRDGLWVPPFIHREGDHNFARNLRLHAAYRIPAQHVRQFHFTDGGTCRAYTRMHTQEQKPDDPGKKPHAYCISVPMFDVPGYEIQVFLPLRGMRLTMPVKFLKTPLSEHVAGYTEEALPQ